MTMDGDEYKRMLLCGAEEKEQKKLEKLTRKQHIFRFPVSLSWEESMWKKGKAKKAQKDMFESYV